MADVQIAVIDQQNTQIALSAPSETEVTVAVPGVQGPVGEGVPAGGTANQVLFKQSGTDYDTAWSEITSEMIGDLEIVNADVATNAAIAGTKISPNFGSQNVVTTGTATAAALIPSGSSVPTNGVYLPSANNVAISTNGTGRLFVDASGNVGVGVAGPNTPFHVAGSATINDRIYLQRASSSLFLSVASYWDGSTNPLSGTKGDILAIGNSGGDGVAFVNANTEQMRLTSTGLGLGTSSPGSYNAAANNLVLSESGDAGITIASPGSQGSIFFADGTASGAEQAAGYIYYQHSSDTMALGTSNQQRLTITSTGAVGIGTTTPTTTLDVDGQGRFTNDLLIADSTATRGRVYADSNGLNLRAESGLATRFLQVGAELARLDGSGRLLVGTSATPSASVFGTMISNNLTLEGHKSSVNATSGIVHWVFFNPNGPVGSISTNGSATAYNTSSDYRLKENVVPLTGAADRIKQLKPSQFNFIADPDTTVDGFIAHEAQAVVPECATGTKDEVDDEGNPVYQGIDQSKLVPLLTAALQEALAEIESLKARITALEP